MPLDPYSCLDMATATRARKYLLTHAQALETLLNDYRARHAQCISGAAMPGKYVVMSMVDDYAGLGNQFPSIVTGDSSGPTAPGPHSTALHLILRSKSQ